MYSKEYVYHGDSYKIVACTIYHNGFSIAWIENSNGHGMRQSNKKFCQLCELAIAGLNQNKI